MAYIILFSLFSPLLVRIDYPIMVVIISQLGPLFVTGEEVFMNKHSLELQQKLHREHGFCHLFVVAEGYMYQVVKKGTAEPVFRTYPFDMTEYHVEHGVKHFDRELNGERPTKKATKKRASKKAPGRTKQSTDS